MTDRTTKVLLLAIALGLWGHLVAPWLRPVPVQAQTLLSVENAIMGMNVDLNMHLSKLEEVATGINRNLELIASGRCANRTLC